MTYQATACAYHARRLRRKPKPQRTEQLALFDHQPAKHHLAQARKALAAASKDTRK